MSDLGQLLRKARTEKGISLDELQETTKIRKRYLEAIEEGNYKVLPGNFYVRAFIKSYAETVGLDPNEVLRLYRSVLPALEAEESAEPAVRRRRRRNVNTDLMGKVATRVLMWSFVLLILGLIYFFAYSLNNDKDKNLVDDGKLTENVNDWPPGSGAPQDRDPVQPIEPVTDPEPAEEPTLPVLELASRTAATDFYLLSHTDIIELELTMTGDECWIELHENNRNGRMILSMMFRAGMEPLKWEFDHPVVIRLGKPSAVQLKVAGEPVVIENLAQARNIQIDFPLSG